MAVNRLSGTSTQRIWKQADRSGTARGSEGVGWVEGVSNKTLEAVRGVSVAC